MSECQQVSHFMQMLGHYLIAYTLGKFEPECVDV